jgi:hypothetical protein
MIWTFSFSLILSSLSGFFSISVLWPQGTCTRTTVILRSSLAVGFGCGISSYWFFGWLCLTNGSWFSMFVVSELVITLVLGLLCVLFRPGFINGAGHDPAARTAWNDLTPSARVLRAIFWAMFACAVISFILISLENPHGGFDALGGWNLRARFFARAANWREAFISSPSFAHLDYPLLLPTTIARLWKYIGHEPVLVPLVVAFLFTFSSVGLLYSSLAYLRDARVGYLGAIVLVSTSSFVLLGASQYADTVFGFFMLASIVTLAFYDAAPTRDNAGFLMLTGVAAGFSAWTKNEGILFVLMLMTVRFFGQLKGGGPKLCAHDLTTIMLGLAPILAVLAYFKLAVAPGNYYLNNGLESLPGPMAHLGKAFQSSDTIGHKVIDISRYWLIIKAASIEIWRFGGRSVGVTPFLALYLICLGVKKNGIRRVETGMAVLVLMLIGYFFIYLTTPLNLQFHLTTSLWRLLVALWPSAAFVFFVATGDWVNAKKQSPRFVDVGERRVIG